MTVIQVLYDRMKEQGGPESVLQVLYYSMTNSYKNFRYKLTFSVIL
jgi:hypothetical protein